MGWPWEASDLITLRERCPSRAARAGLFAGTVLENARATGAEPLGRGHRADGAQGRRAGRRRNCPRATTPPGSATVAVNFLVVSGSELPWPCAITADPDLLVLTDPTSSVDAVTEQHIAAALRTHRVGRTTIVLTSSPAFRAVADRLIAPYEGGEPS